LIIDCHTHLNQYESLEKISSLADRVKELLLEMSSHNVDYSIVLSSYQVNKQRPSVSQLIEATKKYDNIGLVAGYSIDNHTEHDLKQYRKWIKMAQ